MTERLRDLSDEELAEARVKAETQLARVTAEEKRRREKLKGTYVLQSRWLGGEWGDGLVFGSPTWSHLRSTLEAWRASYRNGFEFRIVKREERVVTKTETVDEEVEL